MDTVRDIVEEIARLLKDAETRALMGERRVALNLMQQASRLYDEFIPFITTFEDTSLLSARIRLIAQNLCNEDASNDE